MLTRFFHNIDGFFDSLRRAGRCAADKLLRRSFLDARERLLISSFAILVDFVEDECARHEQWSRKEKYRKRSFMDGWIYLRWCADHCQLPHQSNMGREVMSLYIWWTVNRPKRLPWYNAVNHETANSLELIYFQEDQQMLGRLIAIRADLWV